MWAIIRQIAWYDDIGIDASAIIRFRDEDTGITARGVDTRPNLDVGNALIKNPQSLTRKPNDSSHTTSVCMYLYQYPSTLRCVCIYACICMYMYSIYVNMIEKMYDKIQV